MSYKYSHTKTQGVSDALCHTRGYSGDYKGIEEETSYCHTTSRPRCHNNDDNDDEPIKFTLGFIHILVLVKECSTALEVLLKIHFKGVGAPV